MDWIRRNWPDLLIGIALVAVIAGIIATLLTGGSFFPLGQSNQVDDRQNGRSQSAIAGSLQANRAPGSSDTANAGLNGRSETNAGSSSAGSTSESNRTSSTGAPANQAGEAGTDSRRPVAVTALPFPGSSDSGASAQQGSGRAPSAESSPATGEEAPAGNTVANPTGSADTSTAAGSASATPSSSTSSAVAAQQTERQVSSQSADRGGVYRVSVGAFSSSENAERQAETFRDAGYPVFIGTQGDLSIVLVGPYDDQAEAERVAERIRAGNFRIEPVIYRFRPEAAASSAPAGSANASRQSSSEQESGPAGAATLTAAAPSATPQAQPTASAASGARYLQVGAYATAESAAPQRKRLEGLGFRVSQRDEGNLLKLLVGPFAGEEFVAARARLKEQGIEHFPR